MNSMALGILRLSVKKADVKAEAKASGIETHFGELMLIASQKGSELEDTDPEKVMKGRAVFRGDNVKDEFDKYAFFDDKSSNPASTESGKAGVNYGLMKGHKSTKADGKQAYTQSYLGGAYLGGIPTWIVLPKHLRPKSWDKYENPVCRLVYSLYGHPRAGQFWEKHCETKLKSVGFVPVPNWPSCFFCHKTKCLLIVYVDDFHLSGPAAHHEAVWKRIGSVIDIDEPSPFDRFLGCHHDIEETPNGKKCTFKMFEYINQAINMYLEYTGCTLKELRPVQTPFLDQDAFTDSDWTEMGELDSEALALLMKLLYCARLARPDLLRPVNELGRNITKWTKACDKSLHRLFCYLNNSRDFVLVSHMGGDIDELELELSVDADLASEKDDTKSSSAYFCSIKGPQSMGVLAFCFKRQTSTALGTPEAEIVSLSFGLKQCGLPMKDFWEYILGRLITLRIKEDNETAITIIKKGYSPQLRYLERTQRTKLSWLHEVIYDLEEAILEHEDTERMRADLFTKRIKPHAWKHALELICMRLGV